LIRQPLVDWHGGYLLGKLAPFYRIVIIENNLRSWILLPPCGLQEATEKNDFILLKTLLRRGTGHSKLFDRRHPRNNIASWTKHFL
jgi:hypothetical protein